MASILHRRARDMASPRMPGEFSDQVARRLSSRRPQGRPPAGPAPHNLAGRPVHFGDRLPPGDCPAEMGCTGHAAAPRPHAWGSGHWARLHADLLGGVDAGRPARRRHGSSTA